MTASSFSSPSVAGVSSNNAMLDKTTSEAVEQDVVENEDVLGSTSTTTATRLFKTNSSSRDTFPIHKVRSQILFLSEMAGTLSRLFRQRMPLDPPPQEQPDAYTSIPITSPEIQMAMSRLLSGLLLTASLLSIDLHSAITRKMDLNRRKYPVELCQGKAGKYTEYSDATGITRDHGQSTLTDDYDDGDNNDNSQPENVTSLFPSPTSSKTSTTMSSTTLLFLDKAVPDLTRRIRDFATERQWQKYHKPRSLLLALIGELGELAELFQWEQDANVSVHDHPLVSPEAMDKQGQELADVSIYLLRLADVCGVTLVAVEEEEEEYEDCSPTTP